MGLDFSATPNNYVPCRGACLRRDVTRDSGKGRGIGLLRAPQGIEGPKLCLMADIFHTNFVTANNVLGILNSRTVHDSIVVLLGCHPVDLCALIAALEFKLWVILAIDGVDSRLSIVKSLALSLGIIKPTARA
ncbi:formaldehyde dehydrogenase [Ilyonectria robusta]